ncbi:hypothetical protein EDD15DRAFT_2172450, partial [Pisolithus albus]
MSKCYKLFCEQYPDTYKQILSVYKDTVALGNAEKTVAQRQQLFHSTSKRFTQLFNSVAKCHAFEGAFLLAGSVVNQDGGIGYMHTTPSAENFFLERCRADEDEMVGHFKAHIYSRSSLAMVAEAFDGGKEPQDPCAEYVLSLNYIANSLFSLVGRGCNWASGRLFPWKNLPKNLAKSSIVCYNFPDNVLFPGEERQPRPKGGSKGISDLTLAECGTLIAALTDKSKHGLHFVVKPDLHGSPIIYGAPPDTDSKHAFAKRMYANLKCDRHG